MNDEKAMIIVQMISAAGAAKSKYIEAISEAREKNYEEANKLIEEGNDYFGEAHEVHSKLLTAEASSGESDVSLLLLHAEDQMMSAEVFRTLTIEFGMLYKELHALREEKTVEI